MKTHIVMICALICALVFAGGSALADPYVMAVQQARRASDQNTAEQQRIAKAAGGNAPAASATPAAPASPALQATMANINGLQANFAALGNSTSDKPDSTQRISLLNNLSTAAQGTKASADSVRELANDLLAAMNGKKSIVAAQQTRLARDIHALFNSSHLTDAQQKLTSADVQTILTDGGVSLDNAINVTTDLKKIATETK
jgi:hypothetical protein